MGSQAVPDLAPLFTRELLAGADGGDQPQVHRHVVQVRPRPLPDARREGQVHGPARVEDARLRIGVLFVCVAATASVRANAWAAESSTLSYAPRLAEEDGAG